MSDRAVTLWGALAALLLLTALLYAPSQQPEVPRPTSEEAGPDGYLGLKRWLTLEDVPAVALRRRGTDALLAELAPPTGNILISSMPHRNPLRAEEISALTSWVGRGNTLLLLAALNETAEWSPGPGAEDMFEDLEALSGLSFVKVRDEQGEALVVGDLFDGEAMTYVALPGHPVMANVAHLEGRTALSSNLWQVYADGSVGLILRLAKEERHGVDSLWHTPWRNGHVFVSGSSSLLSNEFLGRGDNARFFANMLSWHLAEGGVVLFDDVHQGLSDLYDPAAFFSDSRLHNTVWFILAFWLLYLLGGAARLAGRSRAAAAPQQVDLVAAAGRFLERKLAAPEAGRVMIEAWLQDLRRAGVLSQGAPHEFPAAELEQLPTIDREALRRVHERYSQLGRGDTVDLANLHNTLQILRESMA